MVMKPQKCGFLRHQDCYTVKMSDCALTMLVAVRDGFSAYCTNSRLYSSRRQRWRRVRLHLARLDSCERYGGVRDILRGQLDGEPGTLQPVHGK